MTFPTMSSVCPTIRGPTALCSIFAPISPSLQIATRRTLFWCGYYKSSGPYFEELPGPFPETPEGQRAFLETVNDLILAVPDGRGKGIYWWEPGNTRGRGFFDEEGNTLPVFDVFHKYTRPIHRTDGQ